MLTLASPASAPCLQWPPNQQVEAGKTHGSKMMPSSRHLDRAEFPDLCLGHLDPGLDVGEAVGRLQDRLSLSLRAQIQFTNYNKSESLRNPPPDFTCSPNPPLAFTPRVKGVSKKKVSTLWFRSYAVLRSGSPDHDA